MHACTIFIFNAQGRVQASCSVQRFWLSFAVDTLQSSMAVDLTMQAAVSGPAADAPASSQSLPETSIPVYPADDCRFALHTQWSDANQGPSSTQRSGFISL